MEEPKYQNYDFSLQRQRKIDRLITIWEDNKKKDKKVLSQVYGLLDSIVVLTKKIRRNKSNV